MFAVTNDHKDRDMTAVLPILEERLQMGIRKVVKGRVRVRTVTETLEEEVQQNLRSERYDVERIPIGRELQVGAELPQPSTEGDVTIIPVIEEIVIVEKRLMLKEEIRITRRETVDAVKTPVMLRKQRAIVERLNEEGQLIAEPMERQS